jgi:hypothetical protein
MEGSMTRFPFVTFIILATLSTVGCTSVTPRENFENFRNAEIGSHISQLIPGDVLGTHTRTLDNGNSEYTRDSSGPFGRCVLVREIDAKTERIIAWRTEGDNSGCQIVP